MSEVADGFTPRESRYVVGIDLGTTNCAVAYMVADDSQGRIHCFPVQQWVDLGSREPRELLPSFHYQPLPDEAKLLDGSAVVVGAALAIEAGN